MEHAFWGVHLGCKCCSTNAPRLGDGCRQYRYECFPGTQGSQPREEEWWPRLWPLGGGGPWPGGCASGEGHLGGPLSHGHGMRLLWGQPCLGAILATPRGVSLSLPRERPPHGCGADPAGLCGFGDVPAAAGWEGHDALQPLPGHHSAVPHVPLFLGRCLMPQRVFNLLEEHFPN